MQTARDLLLHELKDAYDAETRLVEGLQKMEKKVTDQKLAQAFEAHRQQTERQLDRLVRVFGAVGTGPEREECEGIKGLIEEFDEFLDEKPSDAVVNVFAANSARKIEHYEIVAYESLIDLVAHLGIEDALPPLREILAEEQATAKQLEEMSGKLLPELA
jgi:ferritin-like metal-binding protein YciE